MLSKSSNVNVKRRGSNTARFGQNIFLKMLLFKPCLLYLPTRHGIFIFSLVQLPAKLII